MRYLIKVTDLQLPIDNYKYISRYVIQIDEIYRLVKKTSDKFNKHKHSFDYFEAIEIINMYKSAYSKGKVLKNDTKKYELEKEHQ